MYFIPSFFMTLQLFSSMSFYQPKSLSSPPQVSFLQGIKAGNHFFNGAVYFSETQKAQEEPSYSIKNAAVILSPDKNGRLKIGAGNLDTSASLALLKNPVTYSLKPLKFQMKLPSNSAAEQPAFYGFLWNENFAGQGFFVGTLASDEKNAVYLQLGTENRETSLSVTFGCATIPGKYISSTRWYFTSPPRKESPLYSGNTEFYYRPQKKDFPLTVKNSASVSLQPETGDAFFSDNLLLDYNRRNFDFRTKLFLATEEYLTVTGDSLKNPASVYFKVSYNKNGFQSSFSAKNTLTRTSTWPKVYQWELDSSAFVKIPLTASSFLSGSLSLYDYCQSAENDDADLKASVTFSTLVFGKKLHMNGSSESKLSGEITALSAKITAVQSISSSSRITYSVYIREKDKEFAKAETEIAFYSKKADMKAKISAVPDNKNERLCFTAVFSMYLKNLLPVSP